MENNETPMPTNKAQLLQGVGQAHDELERTLALLRSEQMTEPLLEGGWSVKDLMAHLSAWEQLTIERIAVRHDAEKLAEIYRRFGEGDEGLDNLNNELFLAEKDKPLPDVRRDFNQSYSDFMQMVADLPEEDLFQEGRSLIWDGAPLWGLIAGNSFTHYHEHTAQIQTIIDRDNQPTENPPQQGATNEAPTDKEQLLTIIQEAHNKLMRTISGVGNEKVEEPLFDGERSIKDIMAHVTAWERLLLSLLPQVNSGQKQLPVEDDGEFEGTDAFNDRVFAENRDRPYEEITAEFDSTYNEVLSVIKSMPEDRLLGPDSPIWWDEDPTWKFIAVNTYDHYTGHAAQIESL